MSTKNRYRIPAVPVISITLLLLIGVQALLNKLEVGLVILAIGFGVIGLLVFARRKNSTTLERILTLNPRDERDEIKIQWGFALVGKITLICMTLLGLWAFSYFGSDGHSRFSECILVDGTSSCHVTESGYFAMFISAIVVFFAASILISAITASLRRD